MYSKSYSIVKKIVSVLTTAIILVTLSGCQTLRSMTPEEREAYYKAHTTTYDVISVNQYLATETNRFGGITSQDVKYHFTYIDSNGNLHDMDDFEHHEYGLTKLVVGDENKYVVVEKGLDTYRYLYLTKETISNLSINQEEEQN